MKEAGAIIARTERLVIRRFDEDDAEYMLAQMNQPAFLRFIGDRGVRTEEDARAYLRDGPLASYREHGFGLYKVELEETGQTVGNCGLLQRSHLEDPDLGFAFLSRYWGCGYAFEAAQAVIAHACDDLRIERVLAVTRPDNESSIRLLRKLGFELQRELIWPDDGELLQLFARDAATA